MFSDLWENKEDKGYIHTYISANYRVLLKRTLLIWCYMFETTSLRYFPHSSPCKKDNPNSFLEHRVPQKHLSHNWERTGFITFDLFGALFKRNRPNQIFIISISLQIWQSSWTYTKWCGWSIMQKQKKNLNSATVATVEMPIHSQPWLIYSVSYSAQYYRDYRDE